MVFITFIDGVCMDDVHQLRIFEAVAQQLSFTKAAQALHLTQSAVSHQIAALEQEIGGPLFERQGRTILLTPAGDMLLQQTRRILSVLQEAKTAVQEAFRPGAGLIRIGAPATACQFIFPAAVREFRASYPDYQLSITPADSPQATKLLTDGIIDIGIVLCGPKSRQLAYDPLLIDELGFLVNPLHPWARRGKVDRTELDQQHYVLYSRQSTTFHIVQSYLARVGAVLRNFTELGSMEAIKELVKLGLSVTVCARWIARREIHDGQLVWLKPPGGRISCTWCAAWRGSRTLRPAEHTFCSLCRSSSKELQAANGSHPTAGDP